MTYYMFNDILVVTAAQRHGLLAESTPCLTHLQLHGIYRNNFTSYHSLNTLLHPTMLRQASASQIDLF